MKQRIIPLGDINTMTPVVHYAEYARSPANYTWGPRTIPDFQFVLVAEGKMELETGGAHLALEQGDCAFYGPDNPHRLRIVSPKGASLFSVHFDWRGATAEPVHPATGIRENAELLADTQTDYCLSVAGHSPILLPHRFRASSLTDRFSRIVAEYREQDPAYEQSMRAHMLLLIGAVVRLLLQTNPDPERQKIAPALEAIQSRLDVSWSVAELARLCGYHPTYFAELFKDTVGMTPKAFMIQARTRKAKQLLLSGEKPEAVANALGYGTIHYFSRNFKACTGLTPSQFRLEAQEPDEPPS